MGVPSLRSDFVRMALGPTSRSAFATKVLLSESVFLLVVLGVLGIPPVLLIWFAMIAVVTVGALRVSDFALERQYNGPELDPLEIEKKTADSHARFFNIAIGAILTAAIGVFSLNYATRTKPFDFSQLDVMSVESWLPDFDNRMADLRNQSSIFSANPLSDVFPLFFPMTLRDGSTDLGNLGKLGSIASDHQLANVVSGYRNFLDVADHYVLRARELVDVSDRTKGTYSDARQKALIVELRGIQTKVREEFFSFQRAYCVYMKSDAFTQVLKSIRSARGYEYVLRSNFCASLRPPAK